MKSAIAEHVSLSRRSSQLSFRVRCVLEFLCGGGVGDLQIEPELRTADH
jgi:hypothetical protein